MSILVELFPTRFSPSSPNNAMYEGLLDDNNSMPALEVLDILSNRIITLSNAPQQNPDTPGGVLVENTGSVGIGIFKDVVDGTALLKKIATDGTNFITLVDDPATDSIRLGINKDTLANSLLADGAIKTALESKISLVNGKVPNEYLDIDGVDYFGVVANEAAMLALDSTVGDWCHRADILGPNGDPEEWVCTGTTPHVLASWKARKDVVAGVSAINGRTGAVNITATDLGLGKVQNYSISEMINLDTPLKIALGLKADSSAVPGIVRSSVGIHPTAAGLLTYNAATGQFASGFTQALKTSYDDAVTKATHTNRTLLDTITPERVAAWDAGGGENPNPNPVPTVDQIASLLTLTANTTTWAHDPAKPNKYGTIDKATLLAPDGLGEGNYFTFDAIMDGVGNHNLQFAGVAPDNWEKLVSEGKTSAYAKLKFSGLRVRSDLYWGVQFGGFGSNKLAKPVFTATDLGATGTRLEFPLSPGANRYAYTRVPKANYDSAIAAGTAIPWGGPQNIDVAPYSPFVLKRDSTQTGSSSYMPAGVWYLRMQAVDTTNAKQPSDFHIVGPYTKS